MLRTISLLELEKLAKQQPDVPPRWHKPQLIFASAACVESTG